MVLGRSNANSTRRDSLTDQFAPVAVHGNLFHNRLVAVCTDIPRRTDVDAPVPSRWNKHVLFGQQEGRCNGFRSEFPFRVLEVDHIIPRRGGG